MLLTSGDIRQRVPIFVPQVAIDVRQITASRVNSFLETVHGTQLRSTQLDPIQLNGKMVVQQGAQLNFVFSKAEFI